MKGTYLVAGATGAIGRSLVGMIKARGGTPLLAGRCPDKLNELSQAFGGLSTIVVDLDKPESVAECIQTGLADTPALSGVCYAAGSVMLKPLRSTTAEQFGSSFALNVVSAAEVIRAATPGLKKGFKQSGQPGSIVMFSSVAARSGFNNHAVVSASKAAVEGLAIALAAELAPAVRVNAVAPSLTHTSNMSAALTANEKMAAAIASAHPIPRLGAPEDSASAAAFLLSSEASWVTGQVLGVDGGRSVIVR